FLGIAKPDREKIEKAVFQKYPVAHSKELEKLLFTLWEKEEREFHYAAISLAKRAFKIWDPTLLQAFETLIRSQSWWDSVDAIASNLVGALLLQFPQLVTTCDHWVDDDDLWMRRTSLIFQLQFKEKTDEERLFGNCKKLMHEKEFFIRKAIGWALRQYSKTNPEKVRLFIEMHRKQLSPLSVREGSKYV
ncbi:MAG TPA: DNA alkylation repair protein, partial [Chlamydiales bacterium]|nr:DNA alkylation repair protein [Chlamydiales bacterium]